MDLNKILEDAIEEVNSTPAKRKAAAKKTRKKLGLKPTRESISFDEDEELEDLIYRAKRAKYEEQIYKAEKLQWIVEKEKLELEKVAGDVQETAFSEFLYYGYMEKCNLDLLSMMKRIEPIIENLVKEKDVKGITKRINKEITSILTEIKKAQKKDVSKWKRELNK